MSASGQSAIDAWTAFWRSGRSDSCFVGRETAVRFAAAWGELVDLLEDGARLLDLATGNGTVARCCAARARSRGIELQIDAIDAADIEPSRDVEDPEGLLRSVRFRAGERLEALPFADGTFDAVASQFGFEYGEEEQTAAETVRVLAPGGRLRLIIHATDGAVAGDIGRRVRRLEQAIAGPLALVLSLARAADAGDAAAIERESPKLAAAAEKMRQLAVRAPPEDAALFYSREFLALWSRRERYRPGDLLRSLEDGWRNATGVALRQRQMLKAARSTEDIARLASRLSGLGMAVEAPRPMRDERRGVRLAWLLDARRNGGRETTPR